MPLATRRHTGAKNREQKKIKKQLWQRISWKESLEVRCMMACYVVDIRICLELELVNPTPPSPQPSLFVHRLCGGVSQHNIEGKVNTSFSLWSPPKPKSLRNDGISVRELVKFRIY
ncbi:hypothetical protein Leryth_016176 [Lithospermum erythrorhizon]|nr:hypothetical protein Leryth_016176 [Lithospermum erythrorhizon]